MKASKDVSILKDLEAHDRFILKFFVILTVLFFSIVIISIPIVSRYEAVKFNPDVGTILNILFIGLIFITAIIGIPVFKYYRKKAIIRTRTIVKWFSIISFPVSVMATTILFVYEIDTRSMGFSKISFMIIGISIAMFLAILFVLLVLLIMGFGMMGVLTAGGKVFVPRVLVRVSKVTTNTSDTMKATNRWTYLKYFALGWRFDIPHTLDTTSLRIDRVRPKKSLPWTVFHKAMIWQIFVWLLLIVYITLNPFFLKSSDDYQGLLSIASSLSIFIPIFVLPWFIYLRLNARIKGQAKDFLLYEGNGKRALQTLVALGSVVFFIRLAVHVISVVDLLTAIVNFFFFFFIATLIFTFVYFNYFEDSLVKGISRTYRKMKKQSKKMGKNDIPPPGL